MEILICIVLGYLVGTLSPAALLAKVKEVDLKHQGTHNLGATNTFMVIGHGYGVLVMLLDIAKAYIVVKVAQLMFPKVMLAGLLSGCSAVCGHVWPFYMKFKGGKGLAAFAGMILAFDAVIFIILAVICFALMLTINYAVVLPVSAAILFPIVTAVRYPNITVIIPVVLVSILILVKNWSNLRKAWRGEVVKFTEYFKKEKTV